MSKVRIIHISDLHLFVDAEGYRRNFSELAWSARVMTGIYEHLWFVPNIAGARTKLERLFGGIAVHTKTALQAMLRTIDDLLAESMPQVVVQTGDVSTFGALVPGDTISFPEWQYWRDRVRSTRERRMKHWIDLFGNHDVWPGTLPILSPFNIQQIVHTFRQEYFPEDMPSRYEIEVESFLLELYAFNSVLWGPISNTLAVGAVEVDAARNPAADGASDQLAVLTELIQGAPRNDARVVRGVLMHHPPHHFPKPGVDSKEGGLRNAASVGECLNNCQVQLVLAGHRHCVHPPRDRKVPFSQPPLSSNTLQLVCGSPTQEAKPERRPKRRRASTHEAPVIPLNPTTSQAATKVKPSFSVYELSEVDKAIVLERKIYEHSTKSARKFVLAATDQFRLSDSSLPQSA